MLRNFLAAACISATLFLSPMERLHADELGHQVILGKATFEKRSTIVPMAVCEGEPCPKPTIYWSLILIDGNSMRYEVNQMFNYGKTLCPEAIELAGTRIEQGSRVALEGRIQTIGSDYAIVSDVNRATLIPGAYTQERETEEFLPASYGWICQSMENRAPLQVDILYSGADVNGDLFDIQVSRLKGNSPPRPVVTASGAIQRMEEDRIVFRGKAEQATLQVLIDRSSERSANLPAFLSISKAEPGAFLVHELLCSRTRF